MWSSHSHQCVAAIWLWVVLKATVDVACLEDCSGRQEESSDRLDLLSRRSKLVRNFQKTRQELLAEDHIQAQVVDLSIQQVFEDLGE